MSKAQQTTAAGERLDAQHLNSVHAENSKLMKLIKIHAVREVHKGK